MKTILITGASSGIGKAAAKLFSEQGWNVAATMRRPENETELTELQNVKVVRLDVTDEASITSAIQETIEAFGKIDVVLNNAGYGTAGPLEAATKEQIQRQFDTNLIGLIDVTRAALPHFREQKDGMFINISSVGGRVAFPTFSLYHATKWAVEGLTESLQYELSPLGIDLKIVEPGGVKTDFASRSLDVLTDPELEEYNPVVAKIGEVFADFDQRPNISTPDQIAQTIFQAATDGKKQLRYVAGQDAMELLGARAQMSDDEFFGMVRQEFLGGLGS